MPKNPSELARLEAELDYAKRRLFEGFHSKSTKQYILNEIHELERQLEFELTQYNGRTSI